MNLQHLICEAEVKRYAKQVRKERNPNSEELRVSAEYLGVLNEHVRAMIERHVRFNGGKRTLKADIFISAKG